jgi:hypothetical protein
MIRINKFLERRKNEEGSSMIFALIVLMLALAATLIIVAYTLTSLLTTRVLNINAVYGTAAQTAISDAVLAANSQNGQALLDAHQGSSNAVTGVVSNSTYSVNWSWYTSRVATTGEKIYYYVYATGYSTTGVDKGTSEKVRVILSSVNVSGASYTGGKIVYQASDQSVHQWGLMGTNSATYNAGSIINSYDSFQTLTPTATTNQSATASNGNLKLASGTGLTTFNQFGSGSASTRCSGTGCASVAFQNQTSGFDMTSLATNVNTQCPNAASTYPSWTASANSGLLTTNSSSQCFNTMTFDSNTTIPASSSSSTPTIAYVKGNITVNAGVQVNAGGAPTALQIYSQAGSSASFVNGTTGSPTKFYGLVAGPSLACNDSAASGTSSTPTLLIYGSLACNSINLGAGTTVWQDLAAANVQPTGTERLIWNVSKFENLN